MGIEEEKKLLSSSCLFPFRRWGGEEKRRKEGKAMAGPLHREKKRRRTLILPSCLGKRKEDIFTFSWTGERGMGGNLLRGPETKRGEKKGKDV